MCYLLRLEERQPLLLLCAESGEDLGVSQLDAGVTQVEEHGPRQRRAGGGGGPMEGNVKTKTMERKAKNALTDVAVCLRTRQFPYLLSSSCFVLQGNKKTIHIISTTKTKTKTSSLKQLIRLEQGWAII